MVSSSLNTCWILKMASIPSKLQFAQPLNATPSLQCRSRNSFASSQNLQVGKNRGGYCCCCCVGVGRERRRKLYPGEAEGLVQEMRFVAIKLHRPAFQDQDKDEDKDKDETGNGSGWEVTLEGYVKYLVDSKLVFDCVEGIVDRAPHPSYAEFRNTGLERSEKLAKDLKWFAEQGCEVPEPSSPGKSYSQYLEELAENNPPAFLCHFYNIYFAHTAGGQMIGRQVASKILDGKELEFHKWDGDLPQMLKNVKEKLNKVAEGWSRQQKNRCLAETDKSFKYSGNLIRLIIL